MPTIPGALLELLLLDGERQAGMIDKPLDQFVTQRRAGRPDSCWNVRRVAQQADCAFRDHFGGRAVTWIAIALHSNARLLAIGRDRDEQEIVETVLALFFRWPLAGL